MTREEAVGQLIRLRGYCLAETSTDDRDVAAIWKTDTEALSIAIAALHGPTREQIERMRGKWEVIYDEVDDRTYVTCSSCKERTVYDGEFEETDFVDFCPVCGAPMTDEAVDVLMKRMELIQNGQSPA